MLKKVPLHRAYRLINNAPVVLITSGNRSERDIATFSWVSMVNSSPAVVAAHIWGGSYTAGLITKYREFVVNVPSIAMKDIVISCGGKSGYETDKFKEFHLKTKKSSTVQPLSICGCPGYLECKIVKKTDFHDICVYYGEVTLAKAEKELFTDRWNLAKVSFLHHLGDNNFSKEVGI